jgi:hypothetical protein
MDFWSCGSGKRANPINPAINIKARNNGCSNRAGDSKKASLRDLASLNCSFGSLLREIMLKTRSRSMVKCV